ncbi:hypothetical protein AB5J62_36155 [Amycolatopsis sp. cg5]|uniref:hypothetical protein n=1 Tax=Amycolatopsis sp. cg5 TaxID=3238802 RepID=UPI003525A503
MNTDESLTPDLAGLLVATLSTYAGISAAEVERQHREIADGSSCTAETTLTGDASQTILLIEQRLRMAPIDQTTEDLFRPRLQALASAPPPMTTTDAAAWQHLARRLGPRIVTIDRGPIELPHMPAAQHAAWAAVLDLDRAMRAHWCLIGGQMVALWCAEAKTDAIRPTDDADVVLGVWLQRDALKEAATVLDGLGFIEANTFDGYGYRYQRAQATIDLLLPEKVTRQRGAPRTRSGRLGLETPGANQALIRAERVPVRLGERLGHVRRPDLTGALISKAAAAAVDGRDTDRHRDDIVVLGKIALETSAYRSMTRSLRPKDRKRLRIALDAMPEHHRSWRMFADAALVRTALSKLAEPRPNDPELDEF